MIDPERIRLLIAVSGRSQADVARTVGVSKSTLSRALKGERRLGPESQQRLIETLVMERPAS